MKTQTILFTVLAVFAIELSNAQTPASKSNPLNKVVSRSNKKKDANKTEQAELKKAYAEENILSLITAAEQNAKISSAEFVVNKERIRGFLHSYIVKGGSFESRDYVFQLIKKSNDEKRRGKEIRAEAAEENNLSAKLGLMMNAEEKDIIALELQSEVVEYFEYNEQYAVCSNE
jgi:hypothetical protein